MCFNRTLHRTIVSDSDTRSARPMNECQWCGASCCRRAAEVGPGYRIASARVEQAECRVSVSYNVRAMHAARCWSGSGCNRMNRCEEHSLSVEHVDYSNMTSKTRTCFATIPYSGGTLCVLCAYVFPHFAKSHCGWIGIGQNGRTKCLYCMVERLAANTKFGSLVLLTIFYYANTQKVN